MTLKERRELGEIQNLIGRGLGCYLNDRDPQRAENVCTSLQKAFDLCIVVLGKYPPIMEPECPQIIGDK